MTKEIYKYAKERDDKLHNILKDFKEEKKVPVEALQLLSLLSLEDTYDNINAAIYRYAYLKEDYLRNVLINKNLNKEEIKLKLQKAYKFTEVFHNELNKQLLNNILNIKDLKPSYKNLIKTIYDITIINNGLHIKWIDKIIGFNEKIIKSFKTKQDAIYELKRKNLFDSEIIGEKPECCYSGIEIINGEYSIKTYVELFKEEIYKISNTLMKYYYQTMGEEEEDEIIESYRKYFLRLSSALNEKDNIDIIDKWEKVDEAWMKIKGPLQMVHPIEYYKDNIRNSVSMSFDLRIDNPKEYKNNIHKNILKMFNNVLYNIDKSNIPQNQIYNLKNIVEENVNKVQLHIGNFVFYSGEELSGLMVAQVIPNNVKISKKFGKKIFSFSDNSYYLQKNKHDMDIKHIFFDKYFIDKEKKLLADIKRWNEIYNITVIGHEYGHILWNDENTEKKMSGENVFKNIEEFKASASGIVSFFDTEEENEYWEDIFINTISRAIDLIAYKENESLMPYYCESIITLNILFESEVLRFNIDDNKLTININKERYDFFKKKYKKTYIDLIMYYIEKKEANLFLKKHAVLNDNNYYISTNEEVLYFSNYYYKIYKEIGNKIRN